MAWKILASDGLDSEAQEILNKHDWLKLVVKKGMSEEEFFKELVFEILVLLNSDIF